MSLSKDADDAEEIEVIELREGHIEHTIERNDMMSGDDKLPAEVSKKTTEPKLP